MIQSYSCRQGRNRGKDKNLKDLPEGILHNLIGVVLDSVGLEKAELDMTAEELKAAPTDFWRSLGENDNDREEQLRKLRDCRAGWKAHLRGCVGSALAEVRVSPCENDVLTPRKEGDRHEGPSGAAREEVEGTNQRTQPTEQSSGHQLDEKLKLLYYSNFVLSFGVSKTMIAAMDDLLEVQGGERNNVKLGSGVRQTVFDICAKYDVKKFYYLLLRRHSPL
ncbi:unnamed protein product [Heligmosomoides polygyrus]|uniref:Skp1 domain-containing protein n=1 Tax=Heligmosomoides polygyrus TaxID=6339 RepID=A0A183GBT3_HELPZ|nr:unnamed protein product [Heligmosomoides polygyrus]